MHDLDSTLLAVLRAEAAAGARAGALTERAVAALRAARLFKLFLPIEWGGLALSLPEACDRIAAIAEADPSAAWAVMIGSGPNWFAGRMAPALAREVFLPAESCIAGAAAAGRAVRTVGGWRVTGSWRWCSGAPWASAFTFTVRDAAEEFVVVVPAADVRLEPGSWSARGLSATASLTAAVDELFVAQRQTFRVDATPPVRAEPIYRVPFDAFAEITMAAVAIGTVRGLLREFRALARVKVPALAAQTLAAQQPVQSVTAEALARVLAAEAAWRTSTRTLWSAIVARSDAAPIAPPLRLEQRLASLGAVHCATGVANRLRPWLGMDALLDTTPIGRFVADALAVAQNAVVAAARFAEAGRAWLEESDEARSALP